MRNQQTWEFVAARFVTNEVVTNRAGIAPFFHLDISTSDIVCVRQRENKIT